MAVGIALPLADEYFMKTEVETKVTYEFTKDEVVAALVSKFPDLKSKDHNFDFQIHALSSSVMITIPLDWIRITVTKKV